MIWTVSKLEIMKTVDIPPGQAPDYGSAEFIEMFGTRSEVIAIHLGEATECANNGWHPFPKCLKKCLNDRVVMSSQGFAVGSCVVKTSEQVGTLMRTKQEYKWIGRGPGRT